MPLADTPTQSRDRGLQAERTALAWNRTGLAVIVNALLALRTGWSSGATSLTLVAIVLLAAAPAAIVYGAWRRRQLMSEHQPIAPPALAIASAAIITLIACGAGIASILIAL